MGVPVINLRGDRYVGHMGETILRHLGLDDFVTESETEYIAKAVELAANFPALAGIRERLRGDLVASTLCDGPGFTRSLEAAYRQIWMEWCQKTKGAGPI